MTKRQRRVYWRKNQNKIKQYALLALITIIVILALGIVGHFDQTTITSYGSY